MKDIPLRGYYGLPIVQPERDADPHANADEARDWQGEWERDVADSGDLR